MTEQVFNISNSKAEDDPLCTLQQPDLKFTNDEHIVCGNKVEAETFVNNVQETHEKQEHILGLLKSHMQSTDDAQQTLLDRMEIATLREENDVLKQACENSQITTSEMVDQLRIVATEVHTLMTNCDRAHDESALLAEEKRALEAKLGELQDTDVMRRELDALTDELKELVKIIKHTAVANRHPQLIEISVDEKEGLQLTNEHPVPIKEEYGAENNSSPSEGNKIEEINGVSEIDGSYEERYIKLRKLAATMKKVIKDLKDENLNLISEQNNIQQKLTAVSEQAKTSQKLQMECDKLMDELDFKNQEIANYKKIIQEADKINEERANKIKNYGIEFSMMKSAVDTLTQTKEDLQNKLVALTEKFKLEGQLVDGFISEQLQKERKEIQKEFETKSKSMNEELQEAKRLLKKKGALDLEMLDYEKTITAYKNRITDKDGVILELNNKLQKTQMDYQTLQKEVEQLHTRYNSCFSDYQFANEQVIRLTQKNNEYEDMIEPLKKELEDAMQQSKEDKLKAENMWEELENLMTQNNLLKSEMAKLEKTKNQELKEIKLEFVKATEITQRKLLEYRELQKEFESYKVRAHNLLQKSKAENGCKGNEEKMKSEIEVLTNTLADLKKRLDIASNDAEVYKTKFRWCESSKEDLENQLKKMTIEIVKRNEKIDMLLSKEHAVKFVHDEAVKKYEERIRQLQDDLELAHNELSKLSKLVENFKHQAEKNSQTSGHIESDESKVTQLPAEDMDSVDGERVHVRPVKNSHNLKSLDQLLAEDEESSEEYRAENIKEINSRLKSSQNQIVYLTNLLNESEMNSARNEQQVALLKEEIRRLSKIVEVKPDLLNMEYLKNVLLRFLKLPASDEKQRLVSVLDTLLKLSPEEKEGLESIAAGTEGDQKPPGGWSAYLGWP